MRQPPRFLLAFSKLLSSLRNQRPNPGASTPPLHIPPCRHIPDLSSAAAEWQVASGVPEPQPPAPALLAPLARTPPPLHKEPFTLPAPPSAPPSRPAALLLPTRGTSALPLGECASLRRGRAAVNVCRLFLFCASAQAQVRSLVPPSTALSSCPPAVTKCIPSFA